MKRIKIKAISLRATAIIASLILATGSLLPVLIFSGGVASATGLLEPREINMSNSAAGATGVTYDVSFTTTALYQLNGIVVDFCANDPIPGDTCNTGSGTSLNNFSLGSSPSVTSTGLNTGTWTATTNATAPYTTLMYASNCTTSCDNTSTNVTLTISNVTNPTPSTYPGSFYARIFTYSTSTGATGYTSTSIGTPVDDGGDALSTTETINVQAKVFETLDFCVYTSACGTAPQAKLGASSTEALSTASTYGSSNVKYDLGTNAKNGVTVTMTGTTLCSALTLSYSNCEGATPAPTIAAMGSTATAPVTGTPQFGMCADPITGVTAASTYSSTTCPALVEGTAYTPGSGLLAGTDYGFNDSSSSGGTNSTGGSTILTSTGPVAQATGYLAFIANISSTTPSGIYNADLNLVATSNF